MSSDHSPAFRRHYPNHRRAANYHTRSCSTVNSYHRTCYRQSEQGDIRDYGDSLTDYRPDKYHTHRKAGPVHHARRYPVQSALAKGRRSGHVQHKR